MRAIVAAAALVFVALGAAAAVPAQADTFQPVPCRDQAWEPADPAFEALPGAQAFYGSYEGGIYRIEVPANWNGDLVLYAHGYRGEGSRLTVDSPPWIRQHLIDQGYAWAASSYACNSYVPGIGLRDTVALIDMFPQVTGRSAPNRVYLVGVSMGGHIAILADHVYPERFAGILALCPAGPTLFDYFAANGAAAEVISGIQFSPNEPPGDTLGRILSIFGEPPNYTAKGLQMASVMIESSGGARPFAFDGLGPYFARTISGAKLAGDQSLLARAASNADWEYHIDERFGLSEAALNQAVRRLPGDPALRGPSGPYEELKPFSGNIGRPLMTLHTTGDMFVPIFLQRDLRRAVEAAGKGSLLVQRIIRDARHCGFSTEEVQRAFDDLTAWATGGPRPAGDDVFASLENAGLQFTQPLRDGDPGTLRPPLPAATPAPPRTGSGLEAGSSPGEPGAWVAGLAVLAVLSAAAAGAALRRRE
ncbi:hypothetical protein HRbin29_01844 [bacterium HR29]|jgi:pimeloyl-ACP methyl ester carboxylesterase|nr:hypothetical protein HRbin29_01844 [bacterium HR29]